MKKYSIGVDYGTLSGRAVLVDLETGNEVAASVFNYPHGVMDHSLPCGKKLEPHWALQHPKDYLDVLSNTIPSVLKEACVEASQVVGVGIDFTACTVLPTLKDGTPLCFLDQFKSRPHSYVKLWKHHAAQEHANQLNQLAEQENQEFLPRYGGKISSEWLFPKLCQIASEDEEIYDRTESFIEATDWVVWQLTGQEKRNSCTAGYKAIWHKTEDPQKGYPDSQFLKKYHPKLENAVDEKLSRDIYPIGAKAGEITAYGAKLTGLREGTPVAVGNVDAHVAVPAVGITRPGQMLMIMGTSTCHIMLSKKEAMVPGMCGVVADGVLPGYFGYEAGQSCVGDHFDWFVKNCVPQHYEVLAREQGVSIHKLLRDRAKTLSVGQSGLVALDWWNGNRSVLVDADLTGLMVGMTLATKPEEIYRTLLEATAFGTRMIIEAFTQSGVEVEELYAAGGIAEKDELMMQIYSDVTNREIKISGTSQAPAFGSALFGAVAAGYFQSIFQGAEKLGKVKDITYKPIPKNVELYDLLYKEYKTLHDFFGKGGNNIMKKLKKIAKKQ